MFILITVLLSAGVLISIALIFALFVGVVMIINFDKKIISFLMFLALLGVSGLFIAFTYANAYSFDSFQREASNPVASIEGLNVYEKLIEDGKVRNFRIDVDGDFVYEKGKSETRVLKDYSILETDELEPGIYTAKSLKTFDFKFFGTKEVNVKTRTFVVVVKDSNTLPIMDTKAVGRINNPNNTKLLLTTFIFSVVLTSIVFLVPALITEFKEKNFGFFGIELILMNLVMAGLITILIRTFVG